MVQKVADIRSDREETLLERREAWAAISLIGAAMDTRPRKPKTWQDHAKMRVSGLRSEVPVKTDAPAPPVLQ